MNQITEVVKQLLIVNVILFIGTYFVPALMDYLPMYYFENPGFQLWQPLTHMFMHANVWHILFNMFALYSFGSVLEQMWGGKKFLLFYILCGLGAAVLHTAVNYWQVHEVVNMLVSKGFRSEDIFDLLSKSMIDRRWPSESVQALQSSYFSVTLGASGAIYGLLVAFAFMFPNAGLALIFIPVPIKAKYFVPVLLAYDLISGVSGSSIFSFGGGIAHFAHIGGAIVGFLLMWTWKKKQFDKYRWDK